MGCNIPRPWKRPPTPKAEPPKRVRIETDVVKRYEQPKKEHITNCPNCCAVITGPICEYCGTRFPDLIEKEVTIFKADGFVPFEEFRQTAYDIGIKLPIKEQR